MFELIASGALPMQMLWRSMVGMFCHIIFEFLASWCKCFEGFWLGQFVTLCFELHASGGLEKQKVYWNCVEQHASWGLLILYTFLPNQSIIFVNCLCVIFVKYAILCNLQKIAYLTKLIHGQFIFKHMIFSYLFVLFIILFLVEGSLDEL